MKEKIKKVIDYIFTKLFPMKNYILLESSPDYSDNTWALYNMLIKHKVNEKYKIIWVIYWDDKVKLNCKNVISINRGKNIISRIIFEYYNVSAKIIIDSNIFIYKKRKEQFRLFLGHGMPLKNATSYNSAIGECNYILEISQFFTKKMAEICQVEDERLLPLGFCRNDDLINYKSIDINIPQNWKNNKLIIWLPTYRTHRGLKNVDKIKERFKYGIPCFESKEDLEKINKLLKKNSMLVLVKLHPAQSTKQLENIELSNIILITDDMIKQMGITLYKLLSKSSALITDYSSVYYDYTITENPIGLAISDLDEYASEVGFVYDYYESIKGNYIYNIDDLEEFINTVNNSDNKKNIDIANRYHDYIDGNSSERVYRFLEKNIL